MEEIKQLREWMLDSNYPVEAVALMSDEEVVAEYEAVTGDYSTVSPIY
ncbi:hypothetical protein [Virgibacillus phage Mimir87]|nr:hypothetical protein [Virgibacillus phage Mimir87]